MVQLMVVDLYLMPILLVAFVSLLVTTSHSLLFVEYDFVLFCFVLLLLFVAFDLDCQIYQNLALQFGQSLHDSYIDFGRYVGIRFR